MRISLNRSPRTKRARTVRLLTVALAGLLLGVASFSVWGILMTPHRTTAFYNPPVLAGQQLWGYCAGGFYARHGDTIVLTSSGHCIGAGTVAYEPDGTTVRGTFSAPAHDPSCPYPGHTCAQSDMNYLVVAPDRIPWGHLNVVDLGVGGYRVIAPGTQALSCAEIAIGDPVEIDGRNIYRTGFVTEKGDNNHDESTPYFPFPCMIAAPIGVAPGDSGGAVLVRGIAAGVTSRSYGGYLGFTPLAEGLAEMGLTLCTTPNCGLTPPQARSGAPSPTEIVVPVGRTQARGTVA